jgi:hypothetical protein
LPPVPLLGSVLHPPREEAVTPAVAIMQYRARMSMGSLLSLSEVVIL